MSLTSMRDIFFLIFIAGLGLSSDGRQTRDIYPAAGDARRIYPGEIVTGTHDAPVTLIAYINYDCAYCAVFEREVLPALKNNFVDKGMLRLVHRVFPMSNDLAGDSFLKSEFALCSAEVDRFSNASDILFNRQQEDFWKHYEQWANASGIEAAQDIKSCVAFHKARHAVILTQQRYASHDVHVTPTVFINGYKIEGLRSYAEYEAAIMQERPSGSMAERGR